MGALGFLLRGPWTYGERACHLRLCVGPPTLRASMRSVGGARSKAHTRNMYAPSVAAGERDVPLAAGPKFTH